MEQWKTPLYQALVNHHHRRPISLHVPGHKNGKIKSDTGSDFYNHILSLDVTELSGLDDLHAPDGVIHEAQSLLKDIYHVQHSYFLVNGSTVGNLAMIFATLKENDIVLVQRNCHKSILNGLQLVKANPVFLEPDYNEEWQLATGISLDTVEEGLCEYPQVKAVILTYPSYYGFAHDIQPIISVCHQHKVAVLVDEAHGAHFIAGSPCPPSAVQHGADMVVQSAHKTLPAMTMGSFLHVNSELIEIRKVAYYLQMLQSSSPSYPIMASLDLSRAYIASYTSEDLEYAIGLVQQVKRELQKVAQIKVLSYGESQGDPLKLTIQSNTNLTGFEIQTRLEQCGLYSELADVNNVLLMFPLIKKESSYPIELIIEIIKESVRDLPVGKLSVTDLYQRKKSLSTLALSYQEQEKRKVTFIPIEASEGYVSAEMIIPYPPGIPLLLPGEKIEIAHIQEIDKWLNTEARFQGGEKLVDKQVKVFE